MSEESAPAGPEPTRMIASVRGLSNRELLARVKALADGEREITAVLIAHLAVLDERQVYLAEGYSSLFTYLTQVLHLSEHAAYGRIQAARAARRYPVILDLLGDGSINLTTITLLAPELTARNHQELLGAMRHKNRRQVEEFIARLRPRPAAPPLIRRLPAGQPGAAASAATGEDGSPRPFETLTSPAPSPSAPQGAPAVPAPRGVVAPLAPQSYRVQFTATAETHAKLRAAQDLLRHQIPDGDIGQVLDRALSALLVDLTRQKVGSGGRPRGSHAVTERGPAPGSRHVPADVRKAVWIRDGGQCAFVSREGRRCTERGFLEFHHVVPFSARGEATVDNIQLRCRAHNGYEAGLDGDAVPAAGDPEPAVPGSASPGSSVETPPIPAAPAGSILRLTDTIMRPERA